MQIATDRQADAADIVTIAAFAGNNQCCVRYVNITDVHPEFIGVD